jgi:hypothetical protein
VQVQVCVTPGVHTRVRSGVTPVPQLAMPPILKTAPMSKVVDTANTFFIESSLPQLVTNNGWHLMWIVLA